MATKNTEQMGLTITRNHLILIYRAMVSMVDKDVKTLAKLESKLAKLASPLDVEYEKLESRIANLASRITTHNNTLKTVKTVLTESESPPSEQSK